MSDVFAGFIHDGGNSFVLVMSLRRNTTNILKIFIFYIEWFLPNLLQGIRCSIISECSKLTGKFITSCTYVYIFDLFEYEQAITQIKITTCWSKFHEVK